ncbi:hypothetical protein FA13DRAFT_1630540 [Coprinellus micaceus]|uniref:Dienelactone hydrolase domain-containing protein n=1 Tax=Coprinellus micaceus TaxID=71717 RepID=A0A4Y7T8Z8_COPMI|nr:hypothetical protein FA13DRAFT_1630540 [Coprinellus micaceus]
MSCPRCAEGYILPGEPKGAIQSDFTGAYLATPSNGATESKRAVLLLTDVFGLPLQNCRIIADEVAERLQCDVWIPDYFDGGHLWTNRASVVDARLASLIALIKEKRGYEKLGAFGYCFGGTTGIRLASTDLIQSVVICHPGQFSLSQVQVMRVPSAWVRAEACIDVDDADALTSRYVLASRKGTEKFVEYEFVDYKGTPHGFAIRPDLRYPDIVEAQKKSVDQIVAWFGKTLSV